MTRRSSTTGGAEAEALVVRGPLLPGTLLHDNDRYEEARDEFRRLVQADPGTAGARPEGMCEFQLKNYERALKELQAARELGISSADVMSVATYQLAVLLNRFEQYELAFEVLRDFAAEQGHAGVIEPSASASSHALLRARCPPTAAR